MTICIADYIEDKTNRNIKTRIPGIINSDSNFILLAWKKVKVQFVPKTNFTETWNQFVIKRRYDPKTLPYLLIKRATDT